MAKRKRHADVSNPFLPPGFKRRTNETHQDELLDSVLNFLELARPGRPVTRDDRGRIVSPQVAEALEKLLKALVDTDGQNCCSISKQDVTNLVLKWTTKNLVYLLSGTQPNKEDSADVAICYSALELCLRMHNEKEKEKEKEKNQDFISQILSQSILHKLIPFTAQCAFQTSDDTTRSHAVSSYNRMVLHLFRPQVDKLCHHLLPLITNLIVQKSELNGQRILPSNIMFLPVAESTLQLLLRALKSTSTNPKRCFQLLSEKNVLLCLSKLCCLDTADSDKDDEPLMMRMVKGIIWEGLFSTAHHIEGFRSLQLSIPKEGETESRGKKGIKIYQEQLLLSLRDITSSVDDSACLVSVNHFLPLIIEGFIHQSKCWKAETEQAGSKRRDPQALEALHFRVWSSLWSYSFTQLQLTSDKLTASCLPILTCMRKSLSLIEVNDVYRPTYADKDQKQFNFLKWQASRLLSIMLDERPAPERRQLILILKQLVELNHLVLHECLPKAIISAVSCGHSDEGNFSEEFIITLVKLYQQLRRIDYLFESIISSQDLLDQNQIDSITVLQDMKNTFAGYRVSSQVAEAISACPHGQIDLLFVLFSASLRGQGASGVIKPNSSSDAGIECAAILFVTFLRHVRVDKHTALEIHSRCNDSLSGCVQSLIDHDTHHHVGLKLCGWILELQTRCAFWMEAENCSELFAASSSSGGVFRPLLPKASKGEIDSVAKNDGTNEAVFLACHRIRYLHSRIYDCAPTGLAAASEEQEEMDAIVSFIFEQCSSQKQPPKPADGQSSFGLRSPWLLLASFLSVWAPHCTDNHARLFVRWIAASLVGPMILDEKLASSCLNMGAKISREEHEVAMILFQDAAFVETQNITAHIHQTGLSYALEALTVAVDWTQTKVQGIYCTSSPYRQGWKAATIQQVSEAVNGSVLPKISSEYDPSVELSKNLLRGCTRLLSAVLSTPMSALLDSEYWVCFDLCIRMDLLFRAILTSGKFPDEAVVQNLQVFLRKIIIKILSKNATSIVKLISSTDFCIRSLEGLSFVGEETFDEELESVTDQLNGSILFYAIRDAGEKALSCLSRWLNDLKSLSTQSGFQLDQNLTILLGLIQGLRLAGHNCPVARALFVEANRSALEETMEDVLSYLERAKDPKRRALLLAARMLEILPTPGTVDPACILKHCKTLDKGTRSLLIGSMLKQSSASAFSLLQASELLTARTFSKLDDTVFIAIAKGINQGEIGKVVSDLKETLHKPARESYIALHIFRLLIDSLEESSSRSVLRVNSRFFFYSGLEAMHQSSVTSESDQVLQLHIVYAFRLISTLARFKDVFIMRERDLAMILSQLCLMVNVRDITESQMKTFSMSCDLVRSLLQRFPKQLYTCVPSLMMTLQHLQSYILKSDLAAHHVADKAQELSRLFEMLVPHRDALKKHVLGLLLDFIGGLDNKISSLKKKCLSTCAFYLLDTLSQYELRQLNSRLDATGKTLFKTVYQNYQKTHVYRGQY